MASSAIAGRMGLVLQQGGTDGLEIFTATFGRYFWAELADKDPIGGYRYVREIRKTVNRVDRLDLCLYRRYRHFGLSRGNPQQYLKPEIIRYAGASLFGP